MEALRVGMWEVAMVARLDRKMAQRKEIMMVNWLAP